MKKTFAIIISVLLLLSGCEISKLDISPRANKVFSEVEFVPFNEETGKNEFSGIVENITDIIEFYEKISKKYNYNNLDQCTSFTLKTVDNYLNKNKTEFAKNILLAACDAIGFPEELEDKLNSFKNIKYEYVTRDNHIVYEYYDNGKEKIVYEFYNSKLDNIKYYSEDGTLLMEKFTEKGHYPYHGKIYDSNGEIIKEEFYDEFGNIQYHLFIEQNGEASKRTKYNSDGTAVVEYFEIDAEDNWREINYNEDGTKIDFMREIYANGDSRRRENYEDGWPKKVEEVYNGILRETYYAEDGTYSVRQFDENERIIYIKTYRMHSEGYISYLPVYDFDGQLLTEEFFNNALDTYKYIQYDNNGNKIYECFTEEIDRKDVEEEYLYKYDVSGELLEKSKYYDGRLIYIEYSDGTKKEFE